VFKTLKIALCIVAAAAFFSVGSFGNSAMAQKEDVPKAQDKIGLSAAEVNQLVIMMDTDKSGKVSKKEFMDFMSAEFDRLDKDKSGELDVKELSQSQFRPSARQSIGSK
jgi:hypothetical protein